MFKRVERKHKRQEKDEELGLNNTDSDESGSGLEHESAQSDADGDQEEVLALEDEDISIAEALKDPIYPIATDPSVYGCVLCRGKLIKNTGMAAAHRKANAHRRRFEHFRQLSADADPRSSARKLVRTINSSVSCGMQWTEPPPGSSKRALKRQVKQAAMCEKRRRHKELKAKAIAKKASGKLSMADDTASVVTSQSSPGLQGHLRKKQKLGSDTSFTRITKVLDDSKELVPRSKVKGTKMVNKSS